MRGSILSQAEIDALLHADRSESYREGLLELFTKAAHKIGARLSKSLAAEVEIEGPYIEGLSHSLGQSITEDSYVVAADLGPHELFMFLSDFDGGVLSAQLGTPVQEGVGALGKVWAAELAALVGLQYSLFTAQSVSAGFLARLLVEEGSILARHLVRLNGEGLEFSLLIKGAQGAALVEDYKLKPARVQAAGGRLLQGKKSPVSEATFMPLDPIGRPQDTHGINLLEDINLTITVELGRTSLTLDQLLDLKLQSVISLARHAGDPVDVYINDRLAAQGEVVVLEENFGVRILEITPQSKQGPDDRR